MQDGSRGISVQTCGHRANRYNYAAQKHIHISQIAICKSLAAYCALTASSSTSANDVSPQLRARRARHFTVSRIIRENIARALEASPVRLREVKCEIDLIGYDGETLAFVAVRTRERIRRRCRTCGEVASGWVDRAAVSDQTARERVFAAVRCAGDGRVSGTITASTAAQKRVQTADVIILLGKSTEGQRNAVI
jgi:hypothetical protein